MEIQVNDLQKGVRYHFRGDLANGRHADGTPIITHEDVVRQIKYVTDSHVVLECGRRFIINENLKINVF